jgi:thiol:disulfide interchange protein DsbD
VADLTHGEYNLPVRFTFQPCNDRECRAPETVEVPVKITVGSSGHPINEAIFSQISVFPGAQTAPPASVQEESELERLIGEYGFWGYFALLGVAFLTGLLLSFSPCTYPMIPITVSIFAGQERSVGRGFFLSLIYVGTMAVVYGVMGLIVALVGGVFGAWLASPPVAIGIAAVFVIFALSMFGLYELQVPMAVRQRLGTTRTGGGVIGSVVLGVVAALVVSPCVGPFVAAILLYIATYGSPLIGFVTLFVFALGLGTLFVVIGTFSSAITRLPRSGEWMESIKKFFGFVLLLMAVYFLRTLVSAEVTALLTALLLIAFGVFGGGLDRLTQESGFFLRLKKFLGILALLVGGYLLLALLFTQGFILGSSSVWLPISGTVGQTEERGVRGWETDLDAALARAKAEGKPVLIETWATWCANCRVLERQTFSHPDVGREAERFVPVKVQLEKADSPETLEFKARFGLKVYSLPTTLLLDSEGNVRKTITGVIDPAGLIAEMQRVK